MKSFIGFDTIMDLNNVYGKLMYKIQENIDEDLTLVDRKQMLCEIEFLQNTHEFMFRHALISKARMNLNYAITQAAKTILEEVP